MTHDIHCDWGFVEGAVCHCAPKPAPPVCKPTLTDALCEARVALEHEDDINALSYNATIELYKLVEALKTLGAIVDGD